MSITAPCSRNSGPFFFYIEGVSVCDHSNAITADSISQLPEHWTWQDLKDLVRKEATHGIWTDMVAEYPSGKPSGKGYVRAQRANEAVKLYGEFSPEHLNEKSSSFNLEYLTQNAALKVHLFEISVSPPLFWRCNCAANHSNNPQLQEVSRVVAQHKLQLIPSTSSPIKNSVPAYPTVPSVQYPTMHTPAAFQSSSNSPAFLAQQMANPGLQQAQQYQQQSPAYFIQRQRQSLAGFSEHQRQYQGVHGPQPAGRQQITSPPVYASSASGIPVNVSGNFVRTENRGIFVSKLNFKAREQDIVNFFSQVGKVVKCDLHRNASNGKSRGNATVQYAKAEDALRAVKTFNCQSWMNMKIEVRLDKETTTITPPAGTTQAQANQPLIVNGSSGDRVRQEK